MNKINNIINNETIKFIEEYYNFENLSIDENLDVINKTKLFDWLKKNAPKKILDDYNNIDFKYTDPNTGQDILNIINNFANIYFKLKNANKVIVHKLIYSESLNKKIIKNLGIGWSLNENYFNNDVIINNDSKNNQFKISSLINFDNINFELTLYKHIDDNRNQYNCYLNKRSFLNIIKINNNELNPPIIGKP